jgi:hypothetical protein
MGIRCAVYIGNVERTCGRCGVAKEESDFHKSRTRPQHWCKACRKEYDAEYWRRTRERRIRMRKSRRRDLVAWSRTLKEGVPCADCGGVYHPAAMQWDHGHRADKLDDVSNLVRRGFSREAIAAEVSKCELVCANCHAVRTFKSCGA